LAYSVPGTSRQTIGLTLLAFGNLLALAIFAFGKFSALELKQSYYDSGLPVSGVGSLANLANHPVSSLVGPGCAKVWVAGVADPEANDNTMAFKVNKNPSLKENKKSLQPLQCRQPLATCSPSAKLRDVLE